MTLSDVKNHILRRTKTKALNWGTTTTDFIFMAIAVNNALERVESLIRQFTSSYDATRFTGSDINTGTAVPKFQSRFHELLALWPEYQYAVENNLKSAPGIWAEIQLKEAELLRFYGMRNYRMFSVTIASPGVFTLDRHGFLSGDRVIFETTSALPTGLSAETWYYVISNGLGDNTFQIASTRDGTAINTSGTQSGTHFVGLERQQRMRPAIEDNR